MAEGRSITCCRWRLQPSLFVAFLAVIAASAFDPSGDDAYDTLSEIYDISDRQAVAAPSLRMELSARDPSCSNLLQTSGDTLLDRVQCALKKGAIRLNRMGKARGMAINPITQTTAGSDFETDVGPGGGDYVGKFTLGTPPKTFAAIVDTGSDLVWIQCKPCSQCFNQPDPLFDPATSTSYRSLPCSNALCQALPSTTCSSSACHYTYGYGDGSGTKGVLSSETITLTKTNGQNLAVRDFGFGCGHQNGGTFSDASGLVGFGRGPVSFPSQLGSLFDYKFSYCLVTWTDATSKTSPMYFGDAAVPQKAGVRYTPLLDSPGQDYTTFYYVQLNGISVAGRKLSIPSGTFDMQDDGSGGVIFDSGTTLTYLATIAYNKLLQAMKSHIKLPSADASAYGLDLCYDVSGVNGALIKSKFPSLTFHFQGADHDLPLENYFIPVTTAGDVLCLSLAGSDQFSIIGNIQQQNFHIFYDLKKPQIGFVPTTCASA